MALRTMSAVTALVWCLAIAGSVGMVRAAEPESALPMSMSDLQTAVVIDAAKTGEPISKYIYGQFIEHLGRCIYGGIWAEMLEDRKFFHPVGHAESPWRPLNDDSKIEMAREGAFVGQHSPRIGLAGPGKLVGIVQAGLALDRGRGYRGRVVLSSGGKTGLVEVSLVWGPGSEARQTITIDNLTSEFASQPLVFTCGGDSDDGRLEIAARGEGALTIGAVSLMPADNVSGIRADTLELLRELGAPIYRWPGGNFVSGYNWKDGIGDPDRRAPRKNPAWSGIEHNDFGFNEFMTLCQLIKAEPYIAVNSGLGDAKAAADQVEYANGGPETPMGQLRASQGHREPYKVKWWSVGNEMYGDWQLGHIPLNQYVRRHNAFAEAMRAVDPTIRLVGVGNAGPWTEGMLEHCAGHTDLISEHFYCGQKPGLLTHVRQIPDNIRRIAEAHRRYRKTIAALAGKDIRVALDEWNYWYGPQLFGELGTRYFLRDALGIAAGLHEYARNSDLFFMANYAQTVNVIGCIKTNKRAAAFETTGLVLKLYRQHFGVVPVAVGGSTTPLDVAAAWTDDHKALTLAVVNPTESKGALSLEVKGAKLVGSARRWSITGPSEQACNEPGKPPQVGIQEREIAHLSGPLDIAPCSVSLYHLPTQP